MKKIIVGLMALALLLSGSNALASGWNTYPSDCPLPLSIGNYTTGQGIQNGSNGCWTLTSVSASQGQVINVAVYYDNTNGTAANNTTINLTQSPAGSMTNPSTSFTFSGNLTSSAGNLALSPVTANITSAQTLTFGQAKWYKMGSNSGVSLPNGQTGYEAFSGGVSLGTIPNGDWGTVLFSFSVGSVVTPQLCQDPSATNYGGALPCVYYNNAICTISNFTVNGSTSPLTVPANSPINVSWTTQNCTSATTSGPNMSTDTRLSGSQMVYINNSGNYMINAYGNNSNPTRSIYVTVSNNNYQTCQDPSASNYGGLLPCNYYNNNICSISSFTANNTTNATINYGQPVTLYWTTNNCTSVSITDLGSNLPTSGSRTSYPSGSMNYILNAYGYSGGNVSQSVHVNVNPIINPPIYTNTCAATGIATSITRTSAQLNGIITNSNGQSANSYFEYGRTVDLGSRTNSTLVNGAYYQVISGLSADTIYYFRSVADCGNGTSYGKIEVFATDGNQVTTTTRTIIRQGTTIIGTESPIMLKIEDRYQAIGVGDTIDYTVTYKNIGRSTLTNPVVQVVVPKGITITNASAGTYSNETNTLTVPLNDLRPGQEGVIYLQGRVDMITSGTAQIVTTAILVYTSPNGAQENAIAYVLNTPKDIVGNVLGASAFWGGFWNFGLIGWLLLIILILLILLIIRRFSPSKSTTTTSPSGTHTTTTHY